MTARLSDEPPPQPALRASTTWDLAALVPGGAAGAAALAQAAVGRAERFAETYRDRVGALTTRELAAACAELEAILADLGRPSTYAALQFDADTRPSAHGALLTQMQELAGEVAALITFFDLEWVDVESGQAERLLSDPALLRYRHHLEELRRSGPYRLSEGEERVLDEKALTGVLAWHRLYDEHLASVVCRLGGEEVELDQALAALESPQRDERRAAEEAIGASLEPGVGLCGRILNIVLAERASDDRLRGFSHWLAEFNLDNEASDASVGALVESVTERYDIPRRWMRAKARALGLERLAAYDERAPVGAIPARVTWAQAHEAVIAAYAGFSEELAATVRRFFDGGWIDAAPRRGKQGGAFCLATVPDAHPYLLLNFSGGVEDVLTLAHELGHGAHGILAADRGALSMTPSLLLAETASIFGETVTFDLLLQRAEDPADRLGMLAKQLDAIVSTIFGQIMVHRFEALIHTERREAGELAVERFGELWLALRREMFGDAVEIGEGRATWWTQVASIVKTPGYVYTYAFGQLLALSLYARHTDGDPAFAHRFLDLLRAGGSRAPAELLTELSVDLEDFSFWRSGLGIVEDLLDQAEAAIDELVG